MREYEEKQLNSRLLLDSRLNEITRRVPEYKKLDNEAIDISMEYARSTLLEPAADSSDRIDSLRNRLKDIGEKKARLLTENGYPADYLTPVYSCPDCKDTGYIGNEKCHCFKQAIIDLLYSQSNIKDILKKENFKNFRLDFYSKDDIDPVTQLSAYDLMTTILTTANQFVKDFPKKPDNLLFFGKSGLGKTFLSHCIADELLKKGYSVLYLSINEFSDIMRNASFDQYEGEMSYSELAEYVKTCDLLILDDLGSENVTEFSVSSLNICINDRILGKHSTLISTNLTPDQIGDAYGERNYSRIVGLYKSCRFYGQDLRINKNR